MPGVQLPIGIDTVNPVPADYKYGPYANTAAAIAAIPQVLRYDGLTVQITGSGEYHWLAADLSDLGLIPKTGGGGAELPIVHYVYLVEDASDAALMGGVGSNVYTTAQAAWDAAYTIAASIFPGKVEIKVGVTTAAGVGNIVLPLLNGNYTTNIVFSGVSSAVSAIGNIDATACGSSLYLNLNNVKLGNLSGMPYTSVISDSTNAVVGNISDRVGNGIFLTFFKVDNTSIGAITTNGASTIAGAITNRLSIYSITTIGAINIYFNQNTYAALDNVGGGISNVVIGTVTMTSSPAQSYIDCTGVAFISTFIWRGVRTSGALVPYVIFKNCIFYDTVTLQTTGSSLPHAFDLINCTILKSIVTTNAQTNLITRVRNCNITNWTEMPNSTIIQNTTFYDPLAATPVVNQLGTGCEFYNCSIVGGSLSIDDSSPKSVKFTSSFSSAKAAMGGNITLT